MAIFAALALAVAADARVGSNATVHAEFPFEFREGLVWLTVRTPRAAEPLYFLFDSVAKVSVLHEQTARRLGVKLGKRVKVHGVGVETTGYWPQRLEVQIGQVPLAREYLVVDLGRLSQACLCPVDGLVGADFIRGRIVQIDYPAQKIRLLAQAPRPAAAEVLPLKSSRGVFQVPLSVNGRARRWVRLDTGCASALQWAVGSHAEHQTASGISIGLAELSIPTVPTTVQLGSRTFANVRTGLHVKPIFPGEAGLLGNSLLAGFRVTLDAVGGWLVLEDVSAVRL